MTTWVFYKRAFSLTMVFYKGAYKISFVYGVLQGRIQDQLTYIHEYLHDCTCIKVFYMNYVPCWSARRRLSGV